MGCNQSKIENEEAVARCKERKRYMKEAVSTRNAFAAAHSAYTTALKNTGAALGDFAQGEVQNPQLPPAADAATFIPPQQTFEIPLPPPPLPDFSPVPLHRSVTMPEIKIAKPDSRPMPKQPIIEEEEEELENEGSLRKRRSNRSTGGGSTSRRVVEEEEATPPPPPPLVKQQPVSDRDRDHVTHQHPQHHHHHAMSQPQQSSAWEYFFPSMENIAGTTLNVGEEETLNKVEEVQRKLFDDKPNRVEVEDEVVTGQRNVEVPSPDPEPVPKHVPEPEEVVETPEPPVGKGLKMKQTPASMEGKRIVPTRNNVNLLQIFAQLDDHFLKASESAHEVSKMLEATRLHYHSNFADNRGNSHLLSFVSIWTMENRKFIPSPLFCDLFQS